MSKQFWYFFHTLAFDGKIIYILEATDEIGQICNKLRNVIYTRAQITPNFYYKSNVLNVNLNDSNAINNITLCLACFMSVIVIITMFIIK